MGMKNDIIEAEFRTKGGSIVQRDMSKISKEIAILTENNKDLKLAKAKLEAADKKYIAGTKTLTKEYKAVNGTIKNNNELLTIQRGKLQVQASKLKLSEMSASQLKKKWNALNKELADPIMKVLPERQARLTKELVATEKQMGKVGVGTKKSMSVMTDLKQLLPTLGVAALVTGLATLGKKFYDLAQQTIGYRQLIAKSTGLSGKELADTTAGIEATSKTFKKEVSELVTVNNTLAKTFKISQKEATNLINKGFLDGADASGEFISMLKEYPVQFKAAGLSAEQSIKIMSQSVKEGVYSDKGADAIKESTIRLREMTPATRAAIDAIGISSKQLETDLKRGTISYFEAIQKVSLQLDKLPPQSTEVGIALADIFGGAGEDAGLEYIKMLGKVDTGFDSVNGTISKSRQAQEDLLGSNQRLSKAWSNMLGTGTSAFTSLKAGFNNMLSSVVESLSTTENALQTERESVNLLVIEMTSSNTTSKRRNEIYAELKKISPDIVKGIDTENISVSTLQGNLEKYNTTMIKKLALQDSEVALADEREKAGEATSERLEKEMELRMELLSIQQQVPKKLGNQKGNEDLAKQIEAINLSSEDVIVKQAKIYELLGKQRNAINTNAAGLVSGIVSAREGEKEATDEVTKSLGAYMDRYKMLFGEEKEDPKKPNSGGGIGGGTGVANATEQKNLTDFMTKSDEDQVAQIKEYFEGVGAGAYEGFKQAYEDTASQNPLNLLPVTEEEEEDIDPDSNYEIQQFMQTAEFKEELLNIQRENGIIGEQEYQDKLSEINAKSEQERYKKKIAYSNKVKQIAQLGANFVSALMQMELDAAGDNEEKKKEIKKKYAVMQFVTAVSGIVVNTAQAIMAALAQLGPIAGGIAAGLVGATGAVQVGVAYKEMQRVKGLEDGGEFGVRRAQDGKEFRAKYDPKKRGFVDKPTVLVGESGSEFVSNAKAVDNHTVRPVLDVIDAAQRSGTIETLNLPAVINSMAIEGRENGGYTNNTSSPDDVADSPQQTTDPEMKALITNTNLLLANLQQNGIKATVGKYGKNGLDQGIKDINKFNKSLEY